MTARAGRLAAGLVWGSFHGPAVDADARDQLDAGIGGIVLFRDNCEDPDQIARLVAGLRAGARGPLRVSIDQEGGHIVRIGAPLTRFPGAMALGAAGDPALARRVGRASGAELAALGIDMVLAPVLDLAAEPRNPTVGARSLGADPERVAALGAALVAGYREGGALAVAKHFPGHGRTATDSHLGCPVVTGGLPTLRQADLVPFRAAIAAGVPAVMAGHVAYEGVTGDLPATLSPAVLRTLLRRELGFAGLLVTDAMIMDAITLRGGVADACVASVRAGVDAVMAMPAHRRVRAGLASALADGTLPEARVRRALGAARRLDAAWRSLVPAPVDRGAHAALAREVAARAVARLPGGSLLPLPRATGLLVIEVASRVASPIEDTSGDDGALRRAIAGRFPRARVLRVASPGAGLPSPVAEAARAAEVVLLVTRDGFAWPGFAAFGAAVAGLGRPLVVAALQSPADLALVPAGDRVATFAAVPASLEALASALDGTGGFPGRLPMTLPGPDAAGAAA